MKLILAIVNNDDSAAVSANLTNGGFFITKLSTTGGFLQTGNTTLLIGAEDDKVEEIKEIIRESSFTREKSVHTSASFGRGMGLSDISAKTPVRGATVFVLNIESFEKL
ncbi:MAG: cyclic-di-AMP receptor [Oscillospiraceae bacterium]|nr:cyclic-di-AMP receptor [Oscillospiraceae bacterium]